MPNSRQSTISSSVSHYKPRAFSFLSLLGLAFAVLNTWVALAASMPLALPYGGPTAVLWGIWFSSLGSAAIAASLAEICHVFPTTGAQYHFAALLSPPHLAPVMSWIGGWLSCAGWWSILGAVGSVASQLINGIVPLWHPDYVVRSWQTYTVYFFFLSVFATVNLFATRHLPKITTFAFFWSIFGVIMIIIIVLTTSRHHYSPASFVFTGYMNKSGWPGGVAWLLGLLQSTYSLTGFDTCMYMILEVPNPEMNAPKVMLSAIAIGTISGFFFIMTLLFSIVDINEVVSSKTGPLLAIYYQATSSKTGATCLLLYSIVCITFCGIGCVSGTSRLTWRFARDKGLPFRKYLGADRDELQPPVWGIIFITALPIIYGLLYFFSTSAFNAIISSSVILLNLSYSLPIVILLLRGRKLLDRECKTKARRFTLGRFGYMINIFALLYALGTSIFFCFPPVRPTTAVNMNYASSVIVAIMLVSLTTWMAYGRKHFTGPTDFHKEKFHNTFGTEQPLEPIPISVSYQKAAETNLMMSSSTLNVSSH